jgi:hypothetical protein
MILDGGTNSFSQTVVNYQYALRNIPEEQKILIYLCWSVIVGRRGQITERL